MAFIKKRIFLSIVTILMVLVIACWPVVLEKITFNRLFSEHELIKFRVVNKEMGYFSSHYQIEVSNNISPYDGKYISAQFDVTSYPSWFSTHYNITSLNPDFHINLDIDTDITGNAELSLLTDTIKMDNDITISPIRLKATLDNDRLNYDLDLYQIAIDEEYLSHAPMFIWRNIQLSGQLDSVKELSHAHLDFHLGKVLQGASPYTHNALMEGLNISINTHKDEQDKISATQKLSIDKSSAFRWPTENLTLQYTISGMDYASLKDINNQLMASLNTGTQDIVKIEATRKKMTQAMDTFLSHGLHFSLDTLAFEQNDDPFKTRFTATLPSGYTTLYSNDKEHNIRDLLKGELFVSASQELLNSDSYLEYAIEQLMEQGSASEQDGNILIDIPLQDIHSTDGITYLFSQYLIRALNHTY